MKESKATQPGNVPMTRPDDVLAVHEMSGRIIWVELDGGQILLCHGGRFFITSDDGGLTWSEPFLVKQKTGNEIRAGGLVRLNGGGIGLVLQRQISQRRSDRSVFFCRSVGSCRTLP